MTETSNTHEDFLAAFGITPEQEEPAEETPVTEEGTEETEGTEEAGTEEQETDASEEAPKGPTAEEKAAYAYAQLRSENSQNKKLLASVAELLGIDVKEHASNLENILKDKIIEAQAQKTNIPAEYIRKLEHLEERDKQYRQEQIKQVAYLGFEKVKKEFGLDNEQLKAFAAELIKDDKNPFEQEMDLVTEYLRRNWKTLQQQAEDRGMQAEAARAAKAQSQGTTPQGKEGKPLGGTSKINTLADLEKFLNS